MSRYEEQPQEAKDILSEEEKQINELLSHRRDESDLKNGDMCPVCGESRIYWYVDCFVCDNCGSMLE